MRAAREGDDRPERVGPSPGKQGFPPQAEEQQSGPLADLSGPVIYREVQRFRQWFLYLPVLIVTVAVWWQFVEQVVLGRSTAEEPVPNWLAWVLAIVFGLGMPAFLLTLRMVTEVRPGLLRVRLFPVSRVEIPTTHILEAAVRHYSPLKEYGGWGVRVSRTHGRAYNAYGSLGVQLVVEGRGPVLIGSQHPEELLAALAAAGARVGRGEDRGIKNER